MPVVQPKRIRQLKATAAATRRCVSLLAVRLAPYIQEWQRLGLSEREIVRELNRCGTVTPADFNPDPYHAPTPEQQWTLPQYQRLVPMLERAERRSALWAKHRRAKSFADKHEDMSYQQPIRRGAGLFAHPERAPLPAFNVRDPRKFEPGEPKARYSQAWFDWVVARSTAPFRRIANCRTGKAADAGGKFPHAAHDRTLPVPLS